jgi:hypothetical protein
MTLPDNNPQRDAAEHELPVGERVYAPASERIPVEPVPGHRDVVEHPDVSTAERQEALHPPEPTFTRVERPSNTPYQPAWSPSTNPNYTLDPTVEDRAASKLPLGLGGSAVVLAGGGLGVWLFLRWQHERNKPINRLRRQATQAAAELRERVPSTDELAQPRSLGALATLLSIGLIVARQMLAQQSRRTPVERVADMDWQHRLASLKVRWSPRRVELEKFSISRH